jgi:hypothetical protein
MSQKFILCICLEKDIMTSYTMTILLMTLSVLWLKVQVFWNVILCHWRSSSWHFEGSQYSHVQGQAFQEQARLLDHEMKVLWSLKMFRTTYPTRRCHISEDLNLPQHCCENPKFCILVILSSNPILT